MTDFNNYKLLCGLIDTLNTVNTVSTNRVAEVRNLIKQINNAKSAILSGQEITIQTINEFQLAVDEISSGNKITVNRNVTTTSTVETFQLGGSIDDVGFKFDETSIHPPEHGTIIQKLWKVEFKDLTTGYVIISDTSDKELSELFNAQLSTALDDAPPGSLEDLDVTISLDELKGLGSQDISSLINGLEKPGLICRQVRDIDIDTDPALIGLTNESKATIKDAVSTLNAAISAEDIKNADDALLAACQAAGLYSTAIGPMGNIEYSDLKRFKLQKDNETVVTVTLSMPVISWSNDPIAGIPVRESKTFAKENRKDDGTCYIVDMGGVDPVIRRGAPNPLPPTRYYNNGPRATGREDISSEGALDRYMGGKCLGINTTNEEVTFETLLRSSDGPEQITLPPLTASWKLDRATFDLGNRHAYYTVFSASRPPPAGFMGVVFAPKQNRLGRGRGEIASGVTLANGISNTGKTFNLQDENGPILDNGNETSSGLKGLTCAFDGHSYAPADLLKFLQDNSFVKGTQYLTIPADATLETVEDVLIPSGQFVPQITQAVATLMQFGNGKYIQDGGPARFQAGLIPFLPGTLAYTPEWHINFIYYNCGRVECEGNTYDITNVALEKTPDAWIKPNHNASFGPPGPSPTNSQESGFSPAFPDTFDPVQLRCGIKNADCLDYINQIKGSVDGEISLSMLTSLEQDNKIFFTEAPGGAMRGWVKFLVVNCPLPVIVQIDVVDEQQETVVEKPSFDESKCITCTCSRESTSISINGALNPIWLEENEDGNDTSIDTRILKFKAGDNIVIRATSGTQHGVSIRMDGQQSNTIFDNGKTLETIQNEVLTELKNELTINNEEDLENNFVALEDDVIEFHGGIPITFKQQASINPINTPDGVVIADFTVKEEAKGSSGSVSCTVHGISMSFKFNVCEN